VGSLWPAVGESSARRYHALMDIYLVGGAVRDRLLGLEVKERDWVVVGATVDEMRERGYRQVGRDFPVFLHPESGEEYALARTERKSGRGYRGFVVHASPEVTLEEDLRRRDLTINAIAEAADGTLTDPFGGIEDLRLGRLCHVSPAFAEDPVRILRCARFAARFASRGFRVADGTQQLMKAMVASGEADALTPERVWAEFERALGEAAPTRFIEVLRSSGALARVLPEIDALFGVPQPAKHHPEIDSGVHTLLVLARAAELSPAPAVRFAALVHDLGKGTTPPAEWPRHIAHEHRGARLVESLCSRLRAPNAFRELGVLAARFHLVVQRATELRTTTLLKLLERTDALRRPERFSDLLTVCQADLQGREGHTATPFPQGPYLEQARALIAGVTARDLAAAGLRGPQIAAALRKRRLAALAALRDGVPPPGGE